MADIGSIKRTYLLRAKKATDGSPAAQITWLEDLLAGAGGVGEALDGGAYEITHSGHGGQSTSGQQHLHDDERNAAIWQAIDELRGELSAPGCLTVNFQHLQR